MDISNLVDRLEEYTKYCKDEEQEACDSLIALSYHIERFSNDFSDMLIKELQQKLEFYQQHSIVIEREEIFTRKYKEVEWL